MTSQQIALDTIACELRGLEALRDALHGVLGDSFARAVDVIADAQGRVIVTGVGKSGHIARKIAATFASTGKPAHFVHPSD
ncbi:MAG: SIS domain-containing protein, partial [Terriglobus sp.]